MQFSSIYFSLSKLLNFNQAIALDNNLLKYFLSCTASKGGQEQIPTRYLDLNPRSLTSETTLIPRNQDLDLDDDIKMVLIIVCGTYIGLSGHF